MTGSQPRKPYHGTVVPMVTPTTPEGNLDEPAVSRIVDHLMSADIAGIFVLGTTGESASIPRSVRFRLVTLVVEEVRKRALVYAGISSNSLEDSTRMADDYFRSGVDVVVAHLPTYFALTPEEQLEYLRLLAACVSGPMMLYNIPSTTHMSLPIDVVEKLSHLSTVAGIKDSENNPQRLEALIQTFVGRDDFSILVGAAPLSAKGLTEGADGIVPSAGNLVPELFQMLHINSLDGNLARAEALQQSANRFAEIYQKNRTLGQSLAALKSCMATMGLCGPDMFPPLGKLSQDEHEQVQRRFRDLVMSESQQEAP